MDIDQSVNKALRQVDFKSCRSEYVSGSGGGSYVKSNVTCNKCGKKGHIKKYCRSKGTGYSDNPPKKSKYKLIEWVTNKPGVSDTKYIATSNMTCNNKKYKWCTSCNNGNGTWGFHWKDGHDEWKNYQGNK